MGGRARGVLAWIDSPASISRPGKTGEIFFGDAQGKAGSLGSYEVCCTERMKPICKKRILHRRTPIRPHDLNRRPLQTHRHHALRIDSWRRPVPVWHAEGTQCGLVSSFLVAGGKLCDGGAAVDVEGLLWEVSMGGSR